ncbi:MAG: ROK family protein, partial [Chloroflexi bacterium]|nr:ROK family protein [Chloroflexota bacterium]
TVGLVNIQTGTLKLAANLEGWRDIPFQAMWEKQFGLRVHVGNEATIAALGENYFGSAIGYHDFIYLALTTKAVGAGMFINGRLYQGIHGYAGEVGHAVLDPDGALCTCGKRGCWEAMLREACSVQLVQERIQNGEKSLIAQLCQGNPATINFKMILSAALAGDALASERINQVIEVLGTGIANLINTFNPQLIVLGGSLGLTLEPFLAAIRTVAARQVTFPSDGSPDIKASSIKSNACALGAVALVLDDILREPIW